MNHSVHPLKELAPVGVDEYWKLALYLPERWTDFTQVVQTASQLQPGENQLIYCKSVSMPQLAGQGYKTRVSVSVILPDGTGINAVKFGEEDAYEANEAIAKAANEPFYLYGKVEGFSGQITLKNFELVDPKWAGRVRPHYKGKTKVLSTDSINNYQKAYLRQACLTAPKEIVKQLGMSEEDILDAIDAEGIPSIKAILATCHTPVNEATGKYAIEKLERIAAIKAIQQAQEHFDPTDLGTIELPQPIQDWREYSDRLPFTISEDQARVIDEIVEDLKNPVPMRRVLSGDVGYGKTAVFATAAASLHKAGGRVAIMLPNETLAEQVYKEILSFWPELAASAALVTGSSKKRSDLSHVTWMVGTTALLFKDVGELQLLIVDEQQKFSREQREEMLSRKTHCLEVTATCIPRSQALIQFGGLKQSILDKAPVEKNIVTNVFTKADKKALFAGVMKTIQNGDQVLVVYPLKTGGESGKQDLETAAHAWEKLFPGDVRIAHGDQKDTENQASLTDMRNQKAKVLIATTVVEVGVNIPNLRRVVVVHPETLGLSMLHQIRGRVARTGGDGWCDLYLPDEVKDKTMERLEVLTRTTNGFEVAREDLKIRGFGDLSKKSKTQSGSESSLIINRPLNPDTVEQQIERMMYRK